MATQQPQLYVCVGIVFAVATLAIISRFLARRMTKAALWIDDYLVICAYISAIGLNAATIYAIYHGVGLHYEDVPSSLKEAHKPVRLSFFIVQICWILSMACSQLAILMFYWRLFKFSSLRIPIITLGIIVLLWAIGTTLVAVFQCTPTAALWDDSITNMRCSPMLMVGCATAHAALDLIIMVLPLLEIRQLKIRKTRKLGIMLLFVSGIFVTSFSMVIVVMSLRLRGFTNSDLTWGMASVLGFCAAEANLAVLVACVPLMRPVFQKFLKIINVNWSKGSRAEDYQHTMNPSTAFALGSVQQHTSPNDDTDSTRRFAHLEDASSSRSDEIFEVRMTSRSMEK